MNCQYYYNPQWKINLQIDDESNLQQAAQTYFPANAFLTNSSILAFSFAVSLFNANEVGHIFPSSRCALSLKPSVEYLALNFPAF